MSKDPSFKYPPIFLSSADSYSDVWELFFMLFKKYWPEYNGTIYLNTQYQEIQVEGLNIVCTKIGKLKSFGREMRTCLDLIDSEYVMLMLIDFIFMDKVDDQKIREYFEFFKSKNLDSLNFQHYISPNQKDTDNSDLVYVEPPAPHVFFNYQIAFWRKKVLYEMVLPHENPWTSEWFGTKRAEKMKIKQALVRAEVGSPINYDQSGCLSKGKWHPVAVDFLLRNNIVIDFEKRGYSNFGNKPSNKIEILKTKFNIKKMLVTSGLLGSYWDLFLRKSITTK